MSSPSPRPDGTSARVGRTGAVTRAVDALRAVRHAVVLAWRRPAVAGLALLAALACVAATAAARADFETRTRALHSMIGAATPTTPMITAEAEPGAFVHSLDIGPVGIATATQHIRDQLTAASLPIAGPADSWTAFEVPGRTIQAPASAARPGAIPAQMRVVYRDTYQAHGKLVAGRWPTAAKQQAGQPVEADLSPTTAKRLGVGVGSTLTIVSPDRSGSIQLLVVGLVVARDPGSPFWASDETLSDPQLQTQLSGDQFWDTAALVGQSQITYLSSPKLAGLTSTPSSAPPVAYNLWWGFPLDLSGLTADGAAPLADKLDTMSAIESSLYYDPSGSVPVTLSTQLTPILRTFAAAQSTTLLEEAMPLYGLALIAAIAGALLAYAAVDRRRAEADVLRARGAATWYLTLQSLADSLLTALPASVAAIAIGATLPGLTPPGLYPIVIAAAVCATLAPALCTALVHRPRRAARVHTPARRPARIAKYRRLILQGALAAACLAGIDLVHSQGLTPGGTTVDPYAAAAPILAATLAALVTINLLPLALRAVRRRAVPLRGVVALLGVARAAHEPGTGQAATFVLTTAACTADLSVALAAQARHAAPGPLGGAATATLNVLAALAVLAACAVAALAVRLGAAARRAADDRLITMGLTANQARAIAIAESAPPALGGALTGALATVPLLRLVGPALGVSAIPASAAMLVLPALAVALPAAVAGAAGTWTLTRGAQ